MQKPNGVENIKLSEVYDTTENAGNILLKYMVHMKTQQSFARNEGDPGNRREDSTMV